MSEATTESREAYADDAPLVRLLGTPARVRIASVFIAERGRDLTKSEVARQAGVARSTVYDHLEDLERLGVVEHTRTEADYSPRYRLAEDSAVATKLHELEGVTLQRLLGVEDGDAG